jgi:hypothetical protein
VIANAVKKVFVQQRAIDEAFTQQQSNISLPVSIEQIRDLKSVTGKNIPPFSCYKPGGSALCI